MKKKLLGSSSSASLFVSSVFQQITMACLLLDCSRCCENKQEFTPPGNLQDGSDDCWWRYTLMSNSDEIKRHKVI